MTTPAEVSAAAGRKPRDDEIEVFGLTDQGKVRKDNQDHFLFCTVHKTLRLRTTSLPEAAFEMASQRLASLFMVADGVGSSAGEAASRVTVESVAAYVTRAMECYYQADQTDPSIFQKELEQAALASHQSVLDEKARAGVPKMATTLTLVLAVWPWLYVLQVGDSRCYLYRAGELIQLTQDQTIAQALVESGALKQSDVARSPFRNVLSSAIGGTAQPVVTRHDVRYGDIVLLCTDGLNKHVPDERIRSELQSMTSAEATCRRLIDLALADGGTDNVTALISRPVLKDATPA
jgi:protein phosphatase